MGSRVHTSCSVVMDDNCIADPGTVTESQAGVQIRKSHLHMSINDISDAGADFVLSCRYEIQASMTEGHILYINH